MPSGLSRSCSTRVMLVSDVERAAHDLVGRRLVHAAGVVAAAPDAGDGPARRDDAGARRGPGRAPEPRPVERGVLRVVARLLDAPLLHLLGVEARGRVEDRHPVAHVLAVVDHRLLHGLHAVEVDQALLVGAHQVGDGHHRDVVEGLEAADAGAGRGVADVVVGRHPGRQRRRRRPTARPRRAAGTRSGTVAEPISSTRTSCDCSLHHGGDVLAALARVCRPSYRSTCSPPCFTISVKVPSAGVRPRPRLASAGWRSVRRPRR